MRGAEMSPMPLAGTAGERIFRTAVGVPPDCFYHGTPAAAAKEETCKEMTCRNVRSGRGADVAFQEFLSSPPRFFIDDGLVSSPDYDPAFPPEHLLSAPQLLFSCALYHISHIYFFM